MANQFIIHGLSEEGKAYRAALEAIQEQHRMVPCEPDCCDEGLCWTCADTYPCATRRLADQGLDDNLARTTKNGDNK